MREHINDIENSINYLDDDDRSEAISECIQELRQHVSDDFFNMKFSVRGQLYRSSKSETDELVFYASEGEYRDATAEDFAIHFIENRWRVVLPLEVATDETVLADDGEAALAELVYVIPDRSFIRMLEARPDKARALYDNEQPDVDIIAEFADCRDIVLEAINAPNFQEAYDRNAQTQIVDEALEPMRDLLSIILEDGESSDARSFSCMTTEYYPVETSLIPCKQLARIPVMRRPDNGTLVIDGDHVSICLPELWDMSIDRINSTEDFVFSRGEPMLVIDNFEENCVYYVPLPAIRAFMPYVRGEVGE